MRPPASREGTSREGASQEGAARRAFARASLAAAVALALPATARGHRAHVTLTQLAAHPEGRRWELVHAVHYHDALQLLSRRAAPANAPPGSPAGNARLALEVERNFRWWGVEGEPLQPSTIGAELRGDSVLIYQQMPAPLRRGTCAVECSFLHALFEEQRNHISIELARPHTLLRLSKREPRGEFEARGLGG